MGEIVIRKKSISNFMQLDRPNVFYVSIIIDKFFRTAQGNKKNTKTQKKGSL
jgi:hypothetical protein